MRIGTTGFALRFAAIVAAVLPLAACGGAGGSGKHASTKDMLAPPVTVRGIVTTVDGSKPDGCTLTGFNATSNAEIQNSTVGRDFAVVFASGAYFDGMRFEVKCPGYDLGYKSKIYSATEISDAGNRIKLGAVTVMTGIVHVSAMVVDETGAAPAGCSVGLYPAGKKEPVTTWPATGLFDGEFKIAEAGSMFTFEATCPGYARRGTSGVYSVQMIDMTKPDVRLRDLVVKR